MFNKVADKPAPMERPRQSLEQWAVDLCVVGPDPKSTEPYRGECIDGMVWREIKGYSTLFACPVCDRAKEKIPSLKKWMGSYYTYSETEMFARKQNRRDVVDSLRKGAARQPELATESVGGDSWASGTNPF